MGRARMLDVASTKVIADPKSFQKLISEILLI